MSIKMENILQDLCRLCAQKHEFLKDVLDDRNKNILELIRQFTQITVTECDNMPTKVCLDCEEKMVTFQLFILECYKVQDTLRKLCLQQHSEYGIKVEADESDPIIMIKPEVKHEYTADDLLNDIQDNSVMNGDDFRDIGDDYNRESDSDEDETVTIAALKQANKNRGPTEKRPRKLLTQQKYSESKRRPVINEFVSFICTVCSKNCANWFKLKSHSERMHKSPPLVQCKCGVILKSKSVMYKHIQDHNTNSNLSCDQCSKIMKSIEALNKHKMRHVPKEERKYLCSVCNKAFSKRDCMRSHEKSHIPVEERKVFNCNLCDLKFTTRGSMLSHRRVVHYKVKSYVCDLCGYACGTNGELRQHRAIHSEEKPFVCKKCSKSFKTYSNLKTHMDTHEDTSYECYVCNRVLNSRRTLRKHLLVHEDKCHHVCSYCNKAFKRRQTLKVHLHTHTGDKPLSCKWCDERFSYASTLRSHRLRCHPDKMAAAAHANTYSVYSHQPRVPTQQDYIKNDIAAITKNVTKNEMEAIQLCKNDQMHIGEPSNKY